MADVTVCSACLTEACWQGVLVCDDARRASITLIRAAEARGHPGNPGYQAALLDAESESWDGPGIDGSAMIEAANERRRAAREQAPSRADHG